MKKTVFFFLMIAALSTSFYSCKTNTDDLWDSIHQLDGRVTSLEELCKQMNGNIGALQTLLQALQSNVSITKVNPVTLFLFQREIPLLFIMEKRGIKVIRVLPVRME